MLGETLQRWQQGHQLICPAAINQVLPPQNAKSKKLMHSPQNTKG
jgi:hypothetical protein